MARNVSDEELQLKKRARRRLVGAIVLVTAVAVVLPMILDSEPKPATQNIDIQIPSPEAGVLSPRPAPLKPVEKAPAAAEPVLPPKAEAKTEPRVEARPEIKPEAAVVARAEPGIETKAETRPAPKPPASAPVPAKQPAAKTESAAKAPASGGFVIQVAALSDAAKARELQAKIAGGGLKVYTEIVQTAKGPVTRVRVGPYASREAAEKARASLQRLQLDGKVIPR